MPDDLSTLEQREHNDAYFGADQDAWPYVEPQRCQWFALCENEATTTVAHPVLGDVPCCERCANRAAPEGEHELGGEG